MKRLIIAALLVTTPAYAAIPEADAGKAQGAMLKRVDASVEKFLTTYKLDHMYATYCRVQMSLDTKDAETGLIPFGVNYRTIPDKATLDLIISSREAYETAYMKLCLSKALKTLDAVNPFEKFDSSGE